MNEQGGEGEGGGGKLCMRLGKADRAACTKESSKALNRHQMTGDWPKQAHVVPACTPMTQTKPAATKFPEVNICTLCKIHAEKVVMHPDVQMAKEA